MLVVITASVDQCQKVSTILVLAYRFCHL